MVEEQEEGKQETKGQKGKEQGKEYGRIKKNNNTDIVVRVDKYKDELGVTIREFITSDRYTGFTKSGTRIPADKWEEFKKIVGSIELE